MLETFLFSMHPTHIYTTQLPSLALVCMIHQKAHKTRSSAYNWKLNYFISSFPLVSIFVAYTD